MSISHLAIVSDSQIVVISYIDILYLHACNVNFSYDPTMITV